MPQNNYIEEHIKKYGRPLNYEIKKEKRTARKQKHTAVLARRLRGIKAKLFVKKLKTIKSQQRQKVLAKTTNMVNEETKMEGPLPLLLMDRGNRVSGKELSHSIKEKRRESSAKYSVPIQRVGGLSEAEAFSVVSTGKRKAKQWKRMVVKPCYVGDNFTRKTPKYERFIRPMALRFKKAHVTHPELGTTFCLPILGLKMNPHSSLYTSLGVLTKGTIIEVNVSELGIVEQGGRVVWGKYAQITNRPEYDGCVNAIMLS